MNLIKRCLILLLSISPTGAYAQNSEAPRDYISLKQIYANTKGDSDSVRRFVFDIIKTVKTGSESMIKYGKELSEMGVSRRDSRDIMLGYTAMGFGYLGSMNKDSAYLYLNDAILLGEEIRYDYGLSSAYNGMGLYEVNFEINYYKAIPYFNKALEAAKRSNQQDRYSVILSNIALMYYFRNDDAGLPYAMECYELGHTTKDDFLIFIGAYMTSSIQYLKEDYDAALKYATEAESILTKTDVENIDNPSNRVIAYNLLGNIYSAKGNDRRAVRYYQEALKYKGVEAGTDIVGTYLSYGRHFMVRKDYNNALEMYLEGVSESDRTMNWVHLNQLYKNISDVYEIIGDSGNALKYHKMYHVLADSTFNIEKERSLSELKVKYELEKRENEIQQNRIKLLQQERRTQVLGLVVVIILIALLGSWYLYNRKNKLYLEIVKQNQETLRARGVLKQEKEREAATENAGNKYVNSPLSDEKGQKLFDQLEELMETEKIYRDKDMTIERLSEKLNTNRSYLSRIINEHSGLNFNNYINKYRINEAVQILSDTDKDILLKAVAFDLGFNSLSPFYNAFQKEIGVPPTKYREKVIELNKRKEKP